MSDTIKSKHLRIGGMTCANCQNHIEEALRDADGVIKARVSWSRGSADVTYDSDVLTFAAICKIIENSGYEVLPSETPVASGNRAIGLIIIIFALFFLISQINLTRSLPLAEAGMSYGMLFLIGLLTSVHCVAMCGGINLSQCIPQTGAKNPVRSSLLYNIGRVISYTIIGGIVGALGSVITFSGAFKGIVQILAGVFMVIMGVNMLGIFPNLRKFQPRLPAGLAKRINIEKAKGKSPLIVGLLNGLMPCGPLQAMQLYALSTGSPLKGAVSMLLFSLGTVPLMFGLGALSSLLSKKFTRKVMTAGAVLVTVLGLTMFSQGAVLSGFALPKNSQNSELITAEIVNGVQLVNSTLESGNYPKITVQAGIPVKWTIDAPKGTINGCNNRMQIPEFELEHKFQTGENIIEFTPTKAGKIPYSCWMGMIRSSITVVETETPQGEVTADFNREIDSK
jgi:sulfite exporter TauE/SafE/copper chaperone CopZ